MAVYGERVPDEVDDDDADTVTREAGSRLLNHNVPGVIFDIEDRTAKDKT